MLSKQDILDCLTTMAKDIGHEIGEPHLFNEFHYHTGHEEAVEIAINAQDCVRLGFQEISADDISRIIPLFVSRAIEAHNRIIELHKKTKEKLEDYQKTLG